MRKNRKDSFAYEVSDKPTVFAISSGMWNRFAEIKAWLCLAWPRLSLANRSYGRCIPVSSEQGNAEFDRCIENVVGPFLN